ncbi:MAG: UDP-3-O-(3-hydroxymyristoyl)glucosamine N-acyltransferase [unclassified Hahellaceae]|nr:UDP-3-O-(3-hydroxymyristoyl)glucosamine N-acyltransferase [Hahellaceae bacterium]|tara:strand:+ start:25053 stop:26165 length:1113 start_codon:yes stop_codon:yes gene_type:complete
MTITLSDVADHLDLPLTPAPVSGAGHARALLSSPVMGLATLVKAGEQHIAFLASDQYLSQLKTTGALAVILKPQHAEESPVPCFVTSDPYAAYAKLTHLFSHDKTLLLFGDQAGVSNPNSPSIHPSARIADDATLGQGVCIGPNVVIGSGVAIGDGARIAAGTTVGSRSRIGRDVLIYPQASIYHDVTIGDRSIIHSHCTVGSDGFGFAPHKGSFIKIEQLGGVRIGSDVEIGAGTTIDRGALDDTVIGDGVKLDNQIQIAHNVEIGDHTVLAACVGIAGSTKVGKMCMIGGGVGIAGHLTICDQVNITGMTLVTKDISSPGVYSSGTAVEPNSNWRRNVARFRQLDGYIRTLINLEKEVRELRERIEQR